MTDIPLAITAFAIIAAVWLTIYFLGSMYFNRQNSKLSNALKVHTESYQRGYDLVCTGVRWNQDVHNAILDEMETEGWDTAYYRKLIKED